MAIVRQMEAGAELRAEITLTEGADLPASPPETFGFILTFAEESWSAAVVPSGSGSLRVGSPTEVRLRFLTREIPPGVAVGDLFTFFDSGRKGEGRVVDIAPA